MSGTFFTATCYLCAWSSEEITEYVGQCAAVWHVYEEHPQAWRSMFGGRLPRDPHPVTVRQAQAEMS